MTALERLLPTAGSSVPVMTVVCSKPANCDQVRVDFLVNSASASFHPAFLYV